VKAARNHYERWHVMTDAERLALLEGMKGRDLAALLHYAEGREACATREELMGLVLVVAAERYLARQAMKAAKKAKRIF
jgi:hypothetical protein